MTNDPVPDANVMADAVRVRVLVAEDIETNRAVLLSMLDRLGVACDIAENGVEALAAAARADYDLILMDLNMPELDGYGATQAIRALPGARGKVPIVACTANAFPDDIVRCREAGMDGHIAKPVRLRQLADELKKHAADRGPGAVSGTVASGPALL